MIILTIASLHSVTLGTYIYLCFRLYIVYNYTGRY